MTKSILNAIDKNNPNKEMAASIAFQTYQTSEGARHNISASFPGMINVGRNEKDLGLGGDRLAAAAFTKIPTAMLNAYKGKSPEEFKEFLEGVRGISHKRLESMDQSLFKDNKLINILNRNAGISQIAGQGGEGYATGSPGALVDEIRKNKGNKKALDALIWGKGLNNLTDAQRELRSGVAVASGLRDENFTAGLANIAAIDDVISNKEKVAGLKEMEANSLNTTRGQAQSEKRLPNKGEVGQAVAGGKELGADAGGAAGIKALADSGREAFEKAGKAAEEEWKHAAKDTAEAFGKSARSLNKATGKLDKTAENLVKSTDAFKVVSEDFKTTMTKVMQSVSTVAEEVKRKLKIGGN
jgi:hypothetical protein